jgi:hypothetical protein
MRSLILLSLLIIIILISTYFFRKSYECFKISLNIYLSKEETATFLLQDDDEYVSSMTPADLHARNVKTNTEYLQKIAFASIDFIESQKVLLDNFTQKADIFLKTLKSPYIDNKLMSQIVWKFGITTNKMYEEGFPHTRKDIIFITPRLLTFSENDVIKILIHEKVHIYQRKHLDLFQTILLKEGYVLLQERKNIPLIRANPDLDKYIYKHPNSDIMMSVYNNATPTSIMDTVSNNGSMEHPFEEIAYNIGNIANFT